MYGYVGWALHRTVDYLVQTKWKEHDLKKRGLFALYTKVLICVNGSPGNPWTLILNFIWYANCNCGRKHFLEVRKSGKENEYISPWPLAKSRLLQVHRHLAVSRRGAGFVSQSHPWCLLRWALERVSTLTLCTIFPYATASVEVSCCQRSQREGGRKKETRLWVESWPSLL